MDCGRPRSLKMDAAALPNETAVFFVDVILLAQFFAYVCSYIHDLDMDLDFNVEDLTTTL